MIFLLQFQKRTITKGEFVLTRQQGQHRLQWTAFTYRTIIDYFNELKTDEKILTTRK